MKKWLLLLLGIICFFAVLGFFMSDHFFYRKIIKADNMAVPDDVFKWITTNIPTAKGSNQVPAPYTTPRLAIETKRKLYCDEGSILMATFCYELGYKTRLVDFIGMDSIAHHTILEVFNNGRWKSYDFFNNTQYSTYKEYVSFPLLMVNYRRYPGWYNQLVNHNYFIKKIFLKIRGIDESRYSVKK